MKNELEKTAYSVINKWSDWNKIDRILLNKYWNDQYLSSYANYIFDRIGPTFGGMETNPDLTSMKNFYIRSINFLKYTEYVLKRMRTIVKRKKTLTDNECKELNKIHNNYQPNGQDFATRLEEVEKWEQRKFRFSGGLKQKFSEFSSGFIQVGRQILRLCEDPNLPRMQKPRYDLKRTVRKEQRAFDKFVKRRRKEEGK